MKAFIFGTFNPVTNAHINMGVVAKNRLGQDCSVIYVPAPDRYIREWKGYGEQDILPEQVRLKLLEGAASVCGFEVGDAEITGLSDGKTYNTVEHYGFDGAVLCLGMDNILGIRKWYRWEELLDRVRLLVFRREGYVPGDPDEVKDILDRAISYELADLYVDEAGISSTMVRRYHAEGNMKRVKYLVPPNVYGYLMENKDCLPDGKDLIT